MFYLRFVSHLLSISIPSLLCVCVLVVVVVAITAIPHRFITQFLFVNTFSAVLMVAILIVFTTIASTIGIVIHSFIHSLTHTLTYSIIQSFIYFNLLCKRSFYCCTRIHTDNLNYFAVAMMKKN